MRVGILLPTSFADPGEWLADARALEAAGADQLWVEVTDDADPLVVLAALAAVTKKVGLGIAAASDEEAEAIAVDPRLHTVQRLARDRATIGVRMVDVVIDGADRWVRVPVPPDQAAWQQTVENAAREGAKAVLLPADARLFDLLREPL
jgi:hypothetical protein